MDIFKQVPSHITYLFTFLCTCQILLLLYISKTNLKSHHKLDRESKITPISRESHLTGDVVQSVGPLNGKLRLLKSLKRNSVGGESNSNEGNEQNVFPLYQDNLTENLTYPKESKDLPLVTTLSGHSRDAYTHHGTGSSYLSNFTINYIINQPYACHRPKPSNEEEMEDEDKGPAPYMLVLVHSHPSHKAQRDAIRDTWGQVRKDYDAQYPVRVVFILGLSDIYSDLKGPQKESLLFRDIVMGNFTDTYHNLTLKSLFGLQWALTFCPEAHFVMKTDDDVYFNVPNLIQALSGLKDPVHLLGSLNVNSTVQRHGLWRVTNTQFPSETYPSYCSGCAYVLSHNILSSLLTAATKVPMIPIEDVYVTGLLASIANIKCQGSQLFPLWYMGPSPKHLCMLLNSRVYGLHNVPYEKMYYIHRKLKMGHVCQN